MVAYVDVACVGSLDAHSEGRLVSGRLAADVDDDALVADGDVDHGAVHARFHVRRDRDVGEFRLRSVGGIEFEHALED